MFEKIKEWFLRGIDKMLSKSTIEDALKVKTAISNEMDKAMNLWLKIFTNNAPWLNEEVRSLQLGASIAEEFARLITLEMKSEVTGSARADYINEYYQKVLEELKSKLALFNAVGGGFFKPYVKANKFYIDYIPQTDCKPIKFDSAGNITSMAFSSQITKGDKIYTRLETHTLQGTDYIIENKVYVTESYNSTMLGRITSLSEIAEWSELSERTIIQNIERPLFAYYKVPLSNNIDTKSCLGPSVYHKAIDSIRKADIQASRLDYEYESAERSIYADIEAIKNDGTGKAIRSKIVKTLNTDEDNFYKEFSPQLRDEGFIRGENKIKQEIEFQCNLAYGTISDPQSVDKTATEINASKQRSYASVAQMQKSLEYALKHLVKILDVYCDLYELAPSGEYEVSAEWDDSIIVDTESEQRIRLQETNLGLGSKLDYLMWRYGLTEEQAQEKLDRIKQEKSENAIFDEE
jgi:A118 family predicted phage portal protein